MGLIRKEMLIIRDWNRKSNSSAADESFGEVAGKPWTFWKVLRKHPLEGPPEGRFIRSPVVIVRQSKQVYTSHQDSQHFIYFKASSIATVNITIISPLFQVFSIFEAYQEYQHSLLFQVNCASIVATP